MAGVAAIVVGGLSLLRAYTPLVVLPATDYVPADVDPTAIRSRVILLLIIGWRRGRPALADDDHPDPPVRRPTTRGTIDSPNARIEVFWRDKSMLAV